MGLVTAGRYGVAVARLREAESRAKKLTKVIEGLRADNGTWKAKANDATQRLKGVATDAAKHAQALQKQRLEAEKQRNEIEKHRREAEKLRTELQRAHTRDEGVELLRKRLDEAEHALAIAREHLMAVDVKLDILEGAANVLDVRTRSVIAQHAGKTNAPV